MYVFKKETNELTKLNEFNEILIFKMQTFWKTKKLDYLCVPVNRNSKIEISSKDILRGGVRQGGVARRENNPSKLK